MPQPFVSLSARSSDPSAKASRSVSLDYRGLDDLIRKQDAVGGLRDAKFSANYGGDVAGSVTAGNQIRDLLQSIRSIDPGANERSPNRVRGPLVRADSISESDSFDGGSGGWESQHAFPQPTPFKPQAVAPMPNPSYGPQLPPKPPAVPGAKDPGPDPRPDMPNVSNAGLADFIRQGGVSQMRLVDPDSPDGKADRERRMKESPRVLGDIGNRNYA
jgi:hypothetical protein